jgi:DNA-binding MarR family transcriptional regulator
MKKSRQDVDQDYELLFSYFNELGIISQLSTSMFERNLPEGLTISQFGVLNWFVRVDSQATPGRLSTAFQVTKGAMTNTLKKLQAKQFISVEPDASSGRRKIVRLTPEGRQIRDKAIGTAFPLMKEFTRVLDFAEIKQQMAMIKKIRMYLDEYRYKQS